MNKKNILIVEDYPPHFEGIKKTLEVKLSDSVQVFPIVVDRNTKDFSNNNYLIDQITVSKNFKGVLESYNKIDIFIIDIYLRGNEQIGLNFAKYVLDNLNHNFKIVLISNIRLQDEILRDNRVCSLYKLEHGIDFPTPLTKMVANLILEIENV